MDHFQNVVRATREVYSNKSYFAITFLSSILLFSFNALWRNKQLLTDHFSWKLTFLLIQGIFSSFTLSSLFLLIASCLLAGMVITFSVFLIKRQVSGSTESAEASLPSIVLSILLPACPSCALSIFGLLGVGSSLAILPLQGLEFGLLTVIVIVITLMYLSKKIILTTCEVKT